MRITADRMSIRPWLPAMAGLALFLAIEPLRPLFFKLAGEAAGFDLFLAVRAAALVVTLLIAWRSPVRYDWTPHAVPSAISGADPLLSLRGFACLLVLVGHGTLVVFPPSDLDTIVRSPSPYRLLTASPWVGVWIFFVLSGYLMGKGFFSSRFYGPSSSSARSGACRRRWRSIWRRHSSLSDFAASPNDTDHCIFSSC